MAFQATLQTMIVFALLLALGFAAGKTGVIKKESMPALSQLITKIFLPALIFYSMVSSVNRDFVFAHLSLLPLSVLVYVGLALLTFLLAKLMRIPHDKDRIFQFSFIFGNTGFVGLPLLSAVFPETGMLFMCLFSIVDQLTFWTYGVWLSTARGNEAQRFQPKLLLSPNIIAIAAALLFVFLGLSLPGQLDSAVGAVSRAASPLCMLFLGAMICFNKVGSVFKRPELYVGIAIKMLVVPVLAGFAALWAGFTSDIAGCVALYIALPVMAVVPMISAQNGREGEYATGIAVVTFVACLVTIPLVAFFVL